MLDRRRAQTRAATPAILAARGRWGLALGVLLEVLACSIALVGLVQGSGWWFALIGTAALLVVVPAALRSAGVSARLAFGVDVLVFALLVQLAFDAHGSVLGLIPTRDSIAGLRGLFERAQLAIQQQHVPAEPLPELIFFIVLFGGALTLALELLAVVVRAPATTALVLGGILVVPAVLQPGGLSLIALGAAAAAWLVLLAMDGRLRFGSRGGRAVALAVGASVTLLSLMVAATAPGFVEQGRATNAGPLVLGNSVDPLIDLGADLRRPSPVDVLRYTTASKTPEYLQLTTLDDIHGTDWTHTPGQQTPLAGGTGVAAAPGLDTANGVSAPLVDTTIVVQDLRSGWVPAPYPTTAVQGLHGRSSYQGDDLTIFAPGGDLSGQVYTTTSRDLEPTAAQLADEGPYDEQEFASVARDLSLPRSVPQIITATANKIAASAGGTSEYAIALAIQDYFQDSLNDFTYSTDSPDTLDGASLDVIAQFLRVKEGYCVHFASAMTVLARVLGIPSRVAIGYLPGTLVGTKGKLNTYQVDSSDLHAWPQLYFPGVGWLDFEPTVSRGAAPAYTIPTSEAAAQSSAPQAQTAPQAAATPAPSASALPQQQAAADDNPVAARNGVPLELGILIVLGVLAAPAIARVLRRRGRLTRLREDGAPPGLAWDEIRDTARDLGYAVSPTETPRAFATRLRADWHPDAAHQRALDEVLAQLELSEFGPPRPWERFFELADTTEHVLAGMRSAKPLRVRVLAALAPVSLLAGLGEPRRAGVRTGS